MVLESHVKLRMAEPDFLGKFFLPQKLGKWAKKQDFFNLLGNLVIDFLLNLICNENLYYLLCSCTNPIFGKMFVPEIWVKIISANQIA